ncbi:MAG: nicotinamide-nucleotide adenylyltransferase [Nitrososphaera sp.]|jgi:nicotinamide-nucleotide adenylyltransferase
MKFKRGLLTGRFQPFHNGHLALARQAMAECDELVIVIGSAQFNFIEKDPFTAGERLTMIHAALKEAKMDLERCYVISVPNDENNARWLAGLRSQVPAFDAIYSGNEFVGYLASFYDKSIAIKKPKFVSRKEYNGSNIRSLIAAGRKWDHLVPPAVARAIRDFKGEERIRMMAKSDTVPHRW